MPHQGQREGPLGLEPGQTGGRLQHGLQGLLGGQLTRLGGDRAGDLGQLVGSRQLMLQHDELPLQLHRDLDHGGQDDDEGPVLLAGRQGRVQRLDDLDRAQEPVEVAQHQKRRAVGAGSDC